MVAPAWWGAVAAPAPPTPAPFKAPAGGDVEAAIRQVAGQYRFSDPDLLVATARQETGLNPFAVGDSGQSYGVFQEHNKGRGAGIPVESRQDVAAATVRAINEFNAIRAKNPGVDRGTWAALAQRPLDAAGYARSVNAMLGAAAPSPATGAGDPAAGRPAWWGAVAGVADGGTPAAPPPAAQQPAWWNAVAGAASAIGGAAPRASSDQAGSGLSGDALAKQATAAAWALSQMGSQDFYNLCQRFIENAYGTSGQYRSAAAAANALMKTADPEQADVGDLVFFRPDASNGQAGHVGIYLGGGKMVSATSTGVTQDNIFSNPYWSKLFVGFGDPPNQWQGKASTPQLVQGASALVNSVSNAARGRAPQPAAGPAWWSAVAA